MEPVKIPVDGVLDLHQFQPKELYSLLGEYIRVCLAKGIFNLRIIHGRGKGIQRQRVRSFLEKHTEVLSFTDAPREAGGWGATKVLLNHKPKEH